MLYVISCQNHLGLAYKGGQDPIIHLECKLHQSVAWANENGRCWAFSLSNAGAGYTEFRNTLDDLGQINWDAMDARNWRSEKIKEGKQAEFLVQEFFSWRLVTRIGVRSANIEKKVQMALERATKKPKVIVKPEWYY